jgi:hypothetical protein
MELTPTLLRTAPMLHGGREGLQDVVETDNAESKALVSR